MYEARPMARKIASILVAHKYSSSTTRQTENYSYQEVESFQRETPAQSHGCYGRMTLEGASPVNLQKKLSTRVHPVILRDKRITGGTKSKSTYITCHVTIQAPTHFISKSDFIRRITSGTSGVKIKGMPRLWILNSKSRDLDSRLGGLLDMCHKQHIFQRQFEFQMKI